ncbi:MAG: OmpH family outer membrane protein [Nitrospinae bacterium]|nr:OmpH family outer membrane protein [Nitrospinota bacterium]MBL7020733.1 OmpH family outer membrane protein [Nitrospinaceae bacterium]
MRLTIFRKLRIVGSLLISGFLICGLFTVSAFAADSRIGFLNVQKAVSSTKQWKTNFDKFKEDFTKEKKRIKTKEQKIKIMLENLNKQSFVLDPDLKKKKEDEFRKEKIDFERYVQDKNADFSKKEKEMTQQILLKMMDVIQKIGKEKKYTMILEQKVVLYHDKGNDLTDIATRAYDRTNK